MRENFNVCLYSPANDPTGMSEAVRMMIKASPDAGRVGLADLGIRWESSRLDRLERDFLDEESRRRKESQRNSNRIESIKENEKLLS